ncbi:MAG: class I SAM-dependent methyltransferase [Bifidobacteriaceae bacterium]|nr:class I SAM-dependent methyltransferase [Bifidobacteriaceae bacterium]
MDLEAVALAISEPGRHLLGELPAYDPQLAIRLSDGLRRRGIDPKLVAAALTQSRLRAKARAKFGQFADQMLFTDEGLQQATRLDVAARHAERYLQGAPGQAGQPGAAPDSGPSPDLDPADIRVVDLTGGVGGDALAMAALGLRVTVYERDPVTAAVARANLAAFPEARVILADSLSQDLTEADALFADPSRRTASGRRVFDPSDYDPPLDQVVGLARQHAIGIKVAPGIAHRFIPPQAEAQWVSVDGAVVEAGLWFGWLRCPAAREQTDQSAGPYRTALVIRHGRARLLAPNSAPGAPLQTDNAADADRPHQVPARCAGRGSGRLEVGPLQDFIYEPDGAVIRAALIAEAAAPLGSATLVSPRIAYVTAARATVENPFLTGYQVEDAFDFNLKRLRAYLRQHGIGQVVVKKRGTAVDPAELRKRLTLKGDGEAVVILTRLGARQSVVIARPLADSKDSP